jgi:hypothetical protein
MATSGAHVSSRARRHQNSSSEEAYAGPDLMLSTPSNSPDNPHLKRIKREKNRSSSDESDNNDIPLVIEDFRCAGPVYLSIPLTHLRAPRELDAAWREQGLEADVSQILKDYNLPKAVANPSTLASAFYTGKEEEEEIADYIEVQTTGSCNKQWIRVAESIIQLCQDRGFPNINIDISDPRGHMPSRTSTIPVDETLVKDWDSVKPNILRALLPNVTWLSIDVVLRSKMYNISGRDVIFTPTILIRIGRHSQEKWTDQRDKIDLFLQSNERYSNFAVEIIRCSPLTLYSDESTSFTMGQHRGRLWQDEAYMGASISCAKSDKFPVGSGTSGCYLQLKTKNQISTSIRVCALTCFHVVIPHDQKELERDQPKHVLEWMKHGIKPDDQERDQLTINMPSRADHEETLKFYEKALTECKDRKFGLWSYEKVLDLINQGEDFKNLLPRSQQHEFSLLQEEVDQYQGWINDAQFRYQDEGEKAVLGEVFAASGFRRRAGNLMDWALIKVRPTRKPKKMRSVFLYRADFQF